MKRKPLIVSIFILLVTILSFTSFAADENNEFTITIENYTVKMTNASILDHIRYVSGIYNTAAEIRNAEDVRNVNAIIIANGTTDDIFTYEMQNGGVYSFWIRFTDGTTRIEHLDFTTMSQSVSTEGLMLTVHNLYGVKDYFVGKGTYNSYRELKNGETVGRVTATKIAGAKSFTTILPDNGDYTVCVRYDDATRPDLMLYFSVEVDMPEIEVNGLQVLMSGLTDVRVIRTAPGTWETPGEVKRAEGARNIKGSALKGSDTLTLQYSAEGTYTLTLEYYNGLIVVKTFEIKQKEPTVEQNGNSVTFGDLDDMYIIRYAKGEYTTSKEIKNASGSKFKKPNSIVDGKIIVDNLESGTYTFCVQYNDNSYNYYTIVVEGSNDNDPETPIIPEEPEIPEKPIEFASSFTVSRAFGNGMIIQRDEKFSVWGWADESENGKYINATFKGQTASAKIVNGKWKATFTLTFSADPVGSTLTVSGANSSVTITDILVGDLYYVIGQSNVFANMKSLENDLAAVGKSNEIAHITYDDSTNIRLFRHSSTHYAYNGGEDKQGTVKVFEDVKNKLISWTKPSTGGKAFSAVGYLFAYELAQKTGIPIGMIQIDASGYPLTTFAPNELADKWGSDIIGTDGIYYMKLGSVENNNLTVYTQQSRFAFNQQLNPFIQFSCAGILWYQGESDFMNTIYNYGKNTWTYSNEFADLMTYYRANFGNSDFPVYIIEIPSCYNYVAGTHYIPMGTIRSEMGTIPSLLPDSYIIPSSDLWNQKYYLNNIHPYCKPAQAKRAASMALANEYGIGNIDYTAGPTLQSIEYVDACTAVLTFKYVGDGLKTYSGNIKGIQVLTSSTDYQTWVNTSNVSITADDQITVTFSQPIYGVRYDAVTEDFFPTEVNLCNSAMIPMVAFADYKD